MWDLYSEIAKRDRPSGTGYAEIADDATDQVLYCTAAPGDELNLLVEDLASREGLAMVAFDESVPEMLPPAARGAVLTAAEVKGLDFHTVCVLNPGRHLEAILSWRDEYRMMSADIESIRRRLAIDELRVAVSRPAERLIWLDINPTAQIVDTVLGFLNREMPQCPVSQSIPEAIRTALAEEQLAVEERVQRCQSDARQYLSIKPEIAWSRAKQAVSLLGDAANAAAVMDEGLCRSARLTLAEVCFCLAFRNVTLAPELGRPDLYNEAAAAAGAAGRYGLMGIIRSIARVIRQDQAGRIVALGNLVQDMVRGREDVEPWLLTELGGKLDTWVSELEAAVGVGNNAVTLSKILPPFYEAMRFPDAGARKRRLYDRAIRLLMKEKRHAEAFEILQGLSERRPADEAECLEEMGEPARAAELYRSLGKLKEALRCYRAIPDFDAAAALIGNIADHPAGPSYAWLLKMRKLVAERPENFGRAMQPSEKKVLQQMLEEALGVARKRPAARKAAAPKPRRRERRRRSGNFSERLSARRPVCAPR